MGYAGKGKLGELVALKLRQGLERLRVRAEYRTSEGFIRDGRTVIVTTPHSFKGYEAELVYVPGVDQFCEGGRRLAAPLYVALTRARSMLVASGMETSGAGQQILAAMKAVADLAGTAPAVDDRDAISSSELVERIRALLAEDHHEWFKALSNELEPTLDVVTSSSGEILGEPLFVGRKDGASIAFYSREAPPSRLERHRVEDAGITIRFVGDTV